MQLGMSSLTEGRTGLKISFKVTEELSCSLWTAGWLGRSSWAVWILNCFLWADGFFWASWILSCLLWMAKWLTCSSWAAWLLYCLLWTAEWLEFTLSADNVSVTLSFSFRVSWVLNGFWEAETGRDEIVWLTLSKISWSSCSYTRWDSLSNRKSSSSWVTPWIVTGVEQQWVRQKNEDKVRVLNSKLASIPWRRSQERLRMMRY